MGLLSTGSNIYFGLRALKGDVTTTDLMTSNLVHHHETKTAIRDLGRGIENAFRANMEYQHKGFVTLLKATNDARNEIVDTIITEANHLDRTVRRGFSDVSHSIFWLDKNISRNIQAIDQNITAGFDGLSNEVSDLGSAMGSNMLYLSNQIDIGIHGIKDTVEIMGQKLDLQLTELKRSVDAQNNIFSALSNPRRTSAEEMSAIAQKWFDSAVENFSRGLIEPEDFLKLLLKSKGALESAIAFFDSDPQYHIRLGRILEMLNEDIINIKNAYNDGYLAAINSAPALALLCLKNIAELELRNGDAKAALFISEKVAKSSDPESAEFQYDLGRYHIAANNVEFGLEKIFRAIALDATYLLLATASPSISRLPQFHDKINALNAQQRKHKLNLRQNMISDFLCSEIQLMDISVYHHSNARRIIHLEYVNKIKVLKESKDQFIEALIIRYKLTAYCQLWDIPLHHAAYYLRDELVALLSLIKKGNFQAKTLAVTVAESIELKLREADLNMKDDRVIELVYHLIKNHWHPEILHWLDDNTLEYYQKGPLHDRTSLDSAILEKETAQHDLVALQSEIKQKLRTIDRIKSAFNSLSDEINYDLRGLRKVFFIGSSKGPEFGNYRHFSRIDLPIFQNFLKNAIMTVTPKDGYESEKFYYKQDVKIHLETLRSECSENIKAIQNEINFDRSRLAQLQNEVMRYSNNVQDLEENPDGAFLSGRITAKNALDDFKISNPELSDILDELLEYQGIVGDALSREFFSGIEDSSF